MRAMQQRHQEQHGHHEKALLAVCCPARQNSWKGKSHDPLRSPVAVTSSKLFGDGVSAWLADTTPAGCVNIALSHLVSEIDLVIAGPNYGYNAGRIYALSSGTLGAAMEGATMGYPGIALSFGAFPSTPFADEDSAGAINRSILAIEELWPVTQAERSTVSPDTRDRVWNVDVPLKVAQDAPLEHSELQQDYNGSLFEKSSGGSASVAFMITRAMKAQLSGLGYSDGQIRSMKPAEAQAIIEEPDIDELAWYSWTGGRKNDSSSKGLSKRAINCLDETSLWGRSKLESDVDILARGGVSVTPLEPMFK